MDAHTPFLQRWQAQPSRASLRRWIRRGIASGRLPSADGVDSAREGARARRSGRLHRHRRTPHPGLAARSRRPARLLDAGVHQLPARAGGDPGARAAVRRRPARDRDPLAEVPARAQPRGRRACGRAPRDRPPRPGRPRPADLVGICHSGVADAGARRSRGLHRTPGLGGRPLGLSHAGDHHAALGARGEGDARTRPVAGRAARAAAAYRPALSRQGGARPRAGSDRGRRHGAQPDRAARRRRHAARRDRHRRADAAGRLVRRRRAARTAGRLVLAWLPLDRRHRQPPSAPRRPRCARAADRRRPVALSVGRRALRRRHPRDRDGGDAPALGIRRQLRPDGARRRHRSGGSRRRPCRAGRARPALRSLAARPPARIRRRRELVAPGARARRSAEASRSRP